MRFATFIQTCYTNELNRVRVALKDETDRPWHEIEQEFLESEYRAVRDRQMKELELEDDLLTKVPVRFVHTLSHEIFTHL